MPHRVSSFFRAHSHSHAPFDAPTDVKKSPRRSSGSRPSIAGRLPAAAAVAHPPLPLDDQSVKMPGPAKLLSLGLHSPKGSVTRASPHKSVTFDMAIESPPLVMHGTPTASTGALLSGMLKLRIHEERLSFDGDDFQMKLAIEVTQKRPFHANCEACAHQKTELQTWTFLQGPATLPRGEHTYPFSFLLPGHLPASTNSHLSQIEYVLRTALTPQNGEPIKHARVLDVQRAIGPADQPRRSVRVFPPTNLTANCELPSVIYPFGETTVKVRLDGAVKRHPDTRSQTQWKLKRVQWSLRETVKSIAPACPKHEARWSGGETLRKGVARQDVRTIASDELKAGWKADYGSADGTIDLEFPLAIETDAAPICDLKSEDGTESAHVLMVEMIVAEEVCPMNRITQVTPTGAARILRMHFNLTVTQRAGLGISWDEEQPPLYENVPASPPGYMCSSIEEYVGAPIPDYEDLSPLEV